MTEHEIQREAVKQLRKVGFTCWTTSSNKKSRCTPGTPDVFVAVGNGMAVCLEFKRARGGKVSREQAIQVEQGKAKLVRSVDEAINAVLEARHYALVGTH